MPENTMRDLNRTMTRGPIEIQEIRRLTYEFVQKHGREALTKEAQDKIEQQVTERHKARIAKCDLDPYHKEVHPFECECHWCTHAEEFDDDPESCPACQEKVNVLKAEADWSRCWLIGDTTKSILETIEPELQAMLDEGLGGSVTIRLADMTHLEWQKFLFEGREFEGFES